MHACYMVAFICLLLPDTLALAAANDTFKFCPGRKLTMKQQPGDFGWFIISPSAVTQISRKTAIKSVFPDWFLQMGVLSSLYKSKEWIEYTSLQLE